MNTLNGAVGPCTVAAGWTLLPRYPALRPLSRLSGRPVSKGVLNQEPTLAIRTYVQFSSMFVFILLL